MDDLKLTNTESTRLAVDTRPPTAPVASGESAVPSIASDRPWVPVARIDPSIRRVLDNRLLVTGLLLLVGPVGLPALWLNRRFSTTAKVLGTLGFLFLTMAIPVAIIWYWCHHSILPLLDAFANSR